MKSVFKYLLDLNYTNTVVLVALALITILLQAILPFGVYVTAFLTGIMLMVVLLSPLIRFKSIIFGRSRILFITPKSNSTILKGYLLSEVVIFITYYIGIVLCLFSLKGQVNTLNYFFDIYEICTGFLSYSIYIFIKIIDVWFSFTAVGMLSIVLSRKSVSKKIRFLSVKIFIRFVILQFITILIVELVGVIMFRSLTRMVISIYIIYLAYRNMKSLDIY